MNAPPEMPEPHTQSAEAEQAQSEYEAAVARRKGWAEDPIVKRICELNSCQPEDVTPEMRRAGKMLIFQEMYGGKRTLVVGRGDGKPELTGLVTRNFLDAEERACALGLVCIDEAVPAHVPGEVPTAIEWDFQHTAQDGTVFRTKGSAASMSTPFRKNDERVLVSFERLAQQGDVAMRAMQKMRVEFILEGWYEMAGSTPFDVTLIRGMSERLCGMRMRLPRDRVEDGVEPRKWQPAKSREIVKRGPVDQKQKAKNRAARKAAKRSKR